MFSLKIETSIDINASINDVWRHLTDFPQYPDWNPMLCSVVTKLALREQVKFQVNMPKKPLKLKAKINSCKENEELKWAGGLAVIFRGEHFFILKKLTEHKTTFIHGENFSGLLLPLLSKKINQSTELYTAMNTALKQRVESAAINLS